MSKSDNYYKERYEKICKYSPIGDYKCYVTIDVNLKNETKICIDKCLKDEVSDLINNKGVETIGCCCGHGILDAYIQVSDKSVERMIELGYKKIPLDEHGNEKNCFKPKTIFRVIVQNQENNE